MALTLVATPGAPNANSYCTAAEATSYHEGHLYSSDWTGASAATKDAALVFATRVLDQKYEWAEWPATVAQALQWPRAGVVDFLGLSLVSSSSIPPQLKNATAELARQLIAENRTADYDVESKGIKSLKVGSIELEFRESASARVVPDAVRAFIPRWWGRLRGSGIVRELTRG